MSILDNIISYVSPRKAIERRFYHERLQTLQKRSSSYAAAKNHRLIGTWAPTDSNVNTLIKNSSATVRARIRQLVRDFPYFAKAVRTMVDYTVGEGIYFQSKIKDAGGKLDKKRIQQVEDAFRFWADKADVAGKLHYYEMMALTKRQDLESGEFMIVKVKNTDRSAYLPLALQVYEADWLTDLSTQPTSKQNEIDQGIEYNKTTGRVVAYHMTDPDGWGKSIRIKAKDVLHSFETLRPGQLRGISPFVPAVLVAHELGEYMDAEMDAAKMAAKYMAFVKSPDIYARQYGRVETDTDTDQQIEEMENAIIEYLRPGEEIELASNPRPGSNFPPFVRLILTMISVSTGVPYELLSGDYQGMNYSTSRTVRNDFGQQLRPIITRHVRHYGQPTFEWFMESAVMSNRLNLPQYFTNPAPYLLSEWQPPGMESIDPLRETKARMDEIKTGLRSPQEVARARGRDLEEIYNEISIAKDMAEDLGLTFDRDISTAVHNNPAAITGGDEDGKEEKERSRRAKLSHLALAH